MKTKIIILLIALFVLAFSAQAVAQTKDATIVGAKTADGSDISYNVDNIQVQATDELVDASIDWDAVIGDFFILDPATSTWFGVDSLNTGIASDDQYFRVYIDEAVHTYGPGETGLQLKYLGGSKAYIQTINGVLQPTYSDINVADGIYPVVLDTPPNLITGVSDHASGVYTNPTLAVDDDIVTVNFITTEKISFTPAPQAWMFDTNPLVATLAQTTGFTDQKHWTATFDINDGLIHEEGLVDLSFQISDLSVNTTNVSFDDPIDVTYKYTPVGIVYVNDSWTSQADVTATAPALIWLWDAFKSVQEGIDFVTDPGTVIVYAGTYNEDLVIDKTIELKPYEAPSKAYDVVTLKGVAVVDHSEVISVQAPNVKIHDFTIETSNTPMGAVTIYGVAVENTGLEIYDNTFRVTNNGSGGLITMLVTDSGVGAGFLHNDVGGLNIHDNYFVATAVLPLKGTMGIAYEGIYVNYNALVEPATGTVTIKDNEFEGALFRAIGTERDNTYIEGNDVSSGLGMGASLYQAYRGIDIMSTAGNLNPNQNNVQIFDNVISEFLWGISLGHTSGGDDPTDIVIGKAPSTSNYGNFITDCSVGIQIHSSANSAVIHYNTITDNTTYGIYRELWKGDDPVKVPAILNADLNWWGDETGPANATYNPQGLNNAISTGVGFSPWWETADMLQETSSAYGIYYAMHNDLVKGGTSLAMSNFASPTDGTITFDVAVDYPVPWNVNLPHGLKVDALITVSPAPPNGATATLNGVISHPFNGTETAVWMSDFTGAVDRPFLYLDNDWSGSVVLAGLDDKEYTFTITSIASEDFTSIIPGNYDDDILAGKANYDFTFDNYYRDYTGNGFVLDDDTAIIADPLQSVLAGTTLDIQSLANNTDGEITLRVHTEWPLLSTVPLPSDDWLVDAWIETDTALPDGAIVSIPGWGLSITMDGLDTGFWTSDMDGFPGRSTLNSHLPYTENADITITGLNATEYNVAIWTVTAASSNFNELVFPVLEPDAANYYNSQIDASLAQYGLAYDTITIQDPMQYALENTTLGISALACNTQDEITLHVQTVWPTFTSTPSPSDLWLVDAWIETDTPLPNGAVITVAPWGLTKTMNGTDLGFWTSDMDGFVGPLSTLNVHTGYTEDLDITVTGLDDQIYNVIIWTVTAADGNFDASKLDPMASQLGQSLDQYGLAYDTVTIQDPIQNAITTTTQTIDPAICYPNDVVEFDITLNYNAARFSSTPELPTALLTDCRITLTPALAEDAQLELLLNSGTLGFADLDAGESVFYLSELIIAMGWPPASTRTPLYQLDGTIQYWTMRLQIEEDNYTDYSVKFETIASDFDVPDKSVVTWTEFLLAENTDYEVSDPIQHLIANTELTIDTINPLLPTEAGISFDVDVDYKPALPTGNNPGYPAEVLYLDALITLGSGQTFPSGTDVTIVKYVDDVLVDTYTGKTLPAGESFAWLSKILNGPDGPRAPLSMVDGTTETWGFAIDDMDYNEYDLTVTSIAATTGNFTDPSSDPAKGFDTTERFELDSDTVNDIEIPYFTTLEIEVKAGASGTWGDPVSQDDDTPNVLNATIDLDVSELDYFYVNLKNTTATNVELQAGYHGFYIDTEHYPAPHALGYNTKTETYTFLEYWASRGVYDGCTGTWEPTMWQIVDGKLPFFYIKVTDTPRKGFIGQTYELIDGLIYQLYGTDVNMRINGDYFLGDYVFTGYVYSAAHDLPPAESGGVAALKSDLITINITLQDQIDTTYPDFAVLDLQDEVQGTDHWIDLNNPSAKITESYVMYLNDLIEYYDININNSTTTTNYAFAPAYQPFYLNVCVLPDGFYDYWDAKGVNDGATSGWQAVMYQIIIGNNPIFYIRVSNDQSMMLVDGLLYQLAADDDSYFRINGTYPLGDYQVTGDLVGINGTMSTAETVINMEFMEALAIGFEVTPDPLSPYVDSFFDIYVDAVDVNGEIVDTSTTVFFSSNYAGATQLPSLLHLLNGELFAENGGMCSEIVSDLQITVSEYDPFTLTGTSDDIVIQAKNNPAAPGGVKFTDVPGDNGGWISVSYILSVDDPFYTAIKDPSYGVSYYVVEIDTVVDPSGALNFDFLATIACYDNGLPGNNYTALLPAPASDKTYNFRMASVYNPNKLGEFDENHISYNEIVTKDGGAQSAWQTGSAAPKDNLPAYANMKVFLQGPYSNGAMTDGAVKPLTSPYDGETIAALPLPNNQIIDWIYVELRLAATGETVKQANGFLLKNGTIVDVNGNSSLPFYYTTDVEYYLVIHHSNHIDIMSALTHTFGDFASQTTSINLTGATAAYGGGFASLGSGNYGLYGGDVNDNNSVTIGDAIEIYNHRGQTGYLIWDFNMNGSVTIGDAISCYNNRGKSTTVPNQTAKDGGHPLDVEITAPNKDDNTVDLQISNPRLEGGMFKMEVQLKRTSEWPFIIPGMGFDNLLKDADLQFDYNPAGFTGAPVYSNLNAGLDTAEYTIGISVAANALTLSITGPDPVTPTMYSPALNVWETICTIELTIADPLENSGVLWNESGTGLVSAAGFGGFLVDTYYGSGDITLPVELSEFKTMFSSANENIELRWDTASENDVNGFNIYRSDVKDLTRAGRHINYSLIPAAGTTTEPQSYVYGDVVADVYATHYYWLEVVDFGGTSSFHGPYAYTPGDIDGDSTPDLIASTQLLGNFPNPAINSTKIKYQIKGTVIDQNATISVYNVRGELVTTLQGRNGVATLDTSNMGHGIYFYRLQTNDYSDIKKLIVVK